MVALQIRDVPEQVRDVLAAQAARSGQSLQRYLLDVVMREARFVENVDLLADLDWTAGTGLTGSDILEALAAGRDERSRST